jgi:ParB-like chromosome segregation protein Spo0J
VNVKITGTTVVPVDDVKPYPNNPRRGDVDSIVESLQAHGQYKPIVVDRKTNYILAGSHTWQAVKRLKWSSVNVTYIDVDEDTAKRIVLADNRTSDLASYDDSALLALLESLSDLEGTGFDGGYLDHLRGQIEGLDSSLEGLIGAPVDEGLPETPISDEVLFKVGQYRWNVLKDPYDVWHSHHLDSAEGRNGVAITTLRAQLGMPELVKQPKPESNTRQVSMNDVNLTIVPIEKLIPLSGNAREGDVGAIAQSLVANGQFRPLVVRTDGTVLIGNHTLFAARSLGWTELAVVYLDVNDEQATKIVLADNRTADLATYDADILSNLLMSIKNWEGTGFDADDVQDILNGGAVRPGHNSSGKVVVNLGAFRFRVDRLSWNVFEEGLPRQKKEQELALRIGLPLDACVFAGEGF